MRDLIQVTFPDGPRMVGTQVETLVQVRHKDPAFTFPIVCPAHREGWRFAETIGPDKHGSFWQAFRESY